MGRLPTLLVLPGATADRIGAGSVSHAGLGGQAAPPRRAPASRLGDWRDHPWSRVRDTPGKHQPDLNRRSARVSFRSAGSTEFRRPQPPPPIPVDDAPPGRARHVD